MGLPLVVAAIWGTLVYTFRPDVFYRCTVGLLVPGAPGWTHAIIGIAVLLALLGIGVIIYNLDRWFPLFYQPYEDDVERAQQVHPSIDECEADLVGKTAHMISLTDVRDPNGWSAWWIRAALRIVYQDTSAKLFGICLRICGERSAAEDVLHEVYLTIWKRAGSRARPAGLGSTAGGARPATAT